MMGKLYRVDPVGCGCTTCCTGESIPAEGANEDHMKALWYGSLSNATGNSLVHIIKEIKDEDGFSIGRESTIQFDA